MKTEHYIPNPLDPDITNIGTNFRLEQAHSRLDPWRVSVRDVVTTSLDPEVYARDRDLVPPADLFDTTSD